MLLNAGERKKKQKINFLTLQLSATTNYSGVGWIGFIPPQTMVQRLDSKKASMLSRRVQV